MGAGVGYAVEISRALCVKFRGRNSCKEGRVVTPQNLEFYFYYYFRLEPHAFYVLLIYA